MNPQFLSFLTRVSPLSLLYRFYQRLTFDSRKRNQTIASVLNPSGIRLTQQLGTDVLFTLHEARPT